jgi:hypothetical protein
MPIAKLLETSTIAAMTKLVINPLARQIIHPGALDLPDAEANVICEWV